MNAINRLSRPVLVLCLLTTCLIRGSVVTISAQAAPTPITIGENQLGTLTDASSGVAYSLSVAAPMSVEIQVLAITAGLAPSFRVLDPSGGVVLDAANPGTETVAYGMPSLSSPGVYTIAVSSASGTAGQYLISVQPGEIVATPTTSPTPEAGSACTATVYGYYVLYYGPGTEYGSFHTGALGTALVFGYFAPPPPEWKWFKVFIDGRIGWLVEPTFELGENCDSLPLLEPPPTPTPTATPVSTSIPSDVCLAWPGAQVIPIRSVPNFTLPDPIIGFLDMPAPVIAMLENPTWFLINDNGLIGWLLATGGVYFTGVCNPPVVASPQELTSTPFPVANVTSQSGEFLPTPTATVPNETCVVQSASGASINVRSGPGTGYSVTGNLLPGVSAPVIGRLADNSWFQVNIGGVIGWVSASVVTSSGNCAGIAIVQPPVPPPTNVQRATVAAPTFPFRATLTPTPTNTLNPLLQITPIIRPGR